MGWTRSPDLLIGRWYALSIGQTGDSSPTWHSHLWGTNCNGIATYWDKHGMPFLPGIGKDQLLLGLSVPLATWWGEDHWDLTGLSSKKLWVLFPYTKAHGMPPHEESGTSPCQSWNLHNHHPGEDRTLLQDRWLLPSSLLLTSDLIGVVLHTGVPLSTMTTGHQKSGHCRAEHADPQKCSPTTACYRKLEPWDPRTLDHWHEH